MLIRSTDCGLLFELTLSLLCWVMLWLCILEWCWFMLTFFTFRDPNVNPERVYRVGLTAAFNGNTNTAIHANTCGGISTPNIETKPSAMIGIQHQKSVNTMNIIRRAIRFWMWFSIERTALCVLRAAKNIQTYEPQISANEIRLSTRKMNTEYSQPLGRSLVICNARQTPERP